MKAFGGDSGRKGALPYAAVAVAVLMVSAAWAATVYSAERTEVSAEDVRGTSDRIDAAAANTETWIEQGLGEIVTMVGKDPDGGTLSERRERFLSLADQWMERMFPAVDCGTGIEVGGWSFDLTSQLLQTAEYGDYAPAYLVATGTVDAVFDDSTGSASRTLDIRADASSALPFAVIGGSLFENAVTGDGSFLSQMMTYQLASLAQYRILNGWGASSYTGETGTASILTREDVSRSYDSCIAAASALYLRTGEEEWTGQADAASVLMGDGKLTVDLNAVYAQALYGAVDEIVAKWFDYFGGASLLSALDGVSDSLAAAWDGIVSFITGSDTDSAAGYVVSVCGGGNYTIHPADSFTVSLEDAEPVTVPYRSADVLSCSAVKSFHSKYRDSTTGFRDWITGIVNDAVGSIGDSKALGVVEFDISKDEDFSDAVLSRALAAVDGCLSDLEEALVNAVEDTEYTDRMSGTIWLFVEDILDTELMCGYGTFAETYLDEINAALEAQGLEPVTAEDLMDDLSFQEAYDAWVSDAYRVMDLLEPLRHVSADNSSVLRDGCISIVKFGLDLADMDVDVAPWIRNICSEISAADGSTAFSGIRAYPEEDGFDISSETMNTRIWLNLYTDSRPTFSVSFDRDSCVHGTGFSDSTAASFTTCWRISVEDRVHYTVTGTDGVSSASGDVPAECSGTAVVTPDITVKALSGWALYGIDYVPSTTLQEDVKALAFSALLVLIDPLMDIMKSLQEALEVLQEAAARLGAVVEPMVERLYTCLGGPMYKLQKVVQESLQQYGCEAVMDMISAIERSYGITLSSQKIVLSYAGWDLGFTFYLGTLDNYTKHIVKVSLEGEVCGADLETTLDLKIKGTSEYTPVVTGTVDLQGDDWHVEGDFDPAMYSNDYMMNLSGYVRTTEFDLYLPVTESYREVDLSLADIPAVGAVLTNIPFIIPGTLVSIDAGIDIRYAVPLDTGVMINEVEANPEGQDKDGEWAEILNLGTSRANLSGWSLTTSHGKTYVFEDGTELPIGARLVAEFEGQFLNNTYESLTLADAEGNVIDYVDLKNDAGDDGRTCQRAIDGLAEWGLYEGTPGAQNSGGLFGKDGMVTSACLNILKESATEALSELGGKVTDEDGVAQLIELILRKALDKGIDSLASLLVEAALYIEVEFTDVTSSATLLGFRVHLSAGKEMAGDVLRYLVGNTIELLLNIEDPYAVDLGESVLDDVYLGVTVYTGYGLPSFIDASGDGDVRLGADVSVNLRGISNLAEGLSGGTVVRAGVVAANVPYGSMPGVMTGNEHMTNDLWLFRLFLYPGAHQAPA